MEDGDGHLPLRSSSSLEASPPEASSPEALSLEALSPEAWSPEASSPEGGDAIEEGGVKTTIGGGREGEWVQKRGRNNDDNQRGPVHPI
jgi:hypothetical protein